MTAATATCGKMTNRLPAVHTPTPSRCGPSAGVVPSRRLGQELRPEWPGPQPRGDAASHRRRQRRGQIDRHALSPPRSGDEPFTHLTSVAFDHRRGGCPGRSSVSAMRPCLPSFAERVAELLRGWRYRPLLPDFWPDVLQQAERTPLLGECFAAARRNWERRWGCHNLEVPLSDLCGGEPFAWFAAHLLRTCRASTPSTTSRCRPIAGPIGFAAAIIPSPIWRRTATGWKRHSGAGARRDAAAAAVRASSAAAPWSCAAAVNPGRSCPAL